MAPNLNYEVRMLVKEKVEQAKAILKEQNLDCWITFARESQINGDPTLAFLVSADITWHSAFILTKTGRAIAIVGRYDKQTVLETGAYDEVIGFVEGIKQPFQEVMQKLNPSTIGLNYSEGSEICDGITHGMFLTMHSLLDDIAMAPRIVSAENVVSALRERKTTTELAHIQSAINHTIDIFAQVSGFIKIGRSEKEIANFMKAEVASLGLPLAWDESVCPAVFTGPETHEAHYAPSAKKVAGGHVLNMDFGVKVNGYCSDLQRTFYIAKAGESDVPADVQKGFDTIVEAIEQARLAIKPGKFGHDIDKVARDVVVNAGYAEFPHGLGHQVGRFSHDGTALLGPPWEKYASKPFRQLEKGMVFTLEPRLTIPGRGIATIEEMVVITDDGAEYLSKPQKELIVN
jgi:Xaa-Pro aminopeptidase